MPPSYTLLSDSEAPVIPLRRAESIALGRAVGTTPASLDHVAITRDAIYVVDQPSNLLRAYSRLGTPEFTLPTGRSGANELYRPVQLAMHSDTLLVTDIDEARGVALVTTGGSVARQFPLHVGSPTVGSVSLRNGVLAVARIGVDTEITNGTATLVALVGPDGKLRASGCPPDALYRLSIKGNGFYARFRFGGVSTAENLIYCRQAITPVVQVLAADGAFIRAIRIAPPFYRRGADQPYSMGELAVDHFHSTWWEHTQFYPLPHGFVSVYGTYDATTDDMIYRLFTCDSVRTQRKCGIASIPGTPVAFLAPDTLVVTERRQPSATLRETEQSLIEPRKLGLYVIGLVR